MEDVQQGEKLERRGNETPADAALTQQMGNEIVGSSCRVPLYLFSHPSIH